MIAQLLSQTKFHLRSQLRNPPVIFFGLAMPVVFLLIFATVFGNETIDSRGGIKQSTYYVPGLIALGIISTTFVNLGISLTGERQNRQLKRLRGTPLAAGAFIGGRVLTATMMAIALTLILLLIGRLAYGVTIPVQTVPAVVLALFVGVASFCCLAFAVTAIIPNEDAAPAILNGIVLPLYFISGVFFPLDDAPGWLTGIADIFPIVHLSEALYAAFDPQTEGVGIEWGHLAIVALWGSAGFLIALRFFRWTPKGE